jgi:hypothetical protein
MGRSSGFAILLAALLLASLQTGALSAFQDDRAGFAVQFRDDVNPYTILGVFVRPGETVPFAVDSFRPGGRYEITVGKGKVRHTGPAAWSWRAPLAKGLYPMRVVERPSGRAMTFNLFVMVERRASASGALNGYRIGSYPRQPLKNNPVYLPPTGFVEVTAANRNVPIAPHFTLGQFLCKQGAGYPKYVALRERLLLKLERILSGINAAGLHADTLYVMSGYRTPVYNAALKDTRYSRHMYGDAADVFVDQNRDGVMDDLNHDGKHDQKDALYLKNLIDRLQGRPDWKPYLGGLGDYRTTAAHGPFVHVDTRGFAAHWSN